MEEGPLPPVKVGFSFKGKKLKPQMAPTALRNLPSHADETLAVNATTNTTAVREMFKPRNRVRVPQTTPKNSRPINSKNGSLPKRVAMAEESLPPPAEVPVLPPVKEDDDLHILETLIKEEKAENPYLQKPAFFIPETRRGFSEFIKQTYEPFILKATSDEVAPGDKYPYQKFVREYMRNDSPYRGILVYHGLGSGKTCTAIATSEALFATANKKIIVMTPFSLRKNFLNEVSFCGFRHFRLQNYWISLDLELPEHYIFAQSVMNIPESYLKKLTRIWIPDFREEEPNYNDLDPSEQTEIRKQILSILVYHPVKNPNGQIRFINYNGVSAKTLKGIACNDSTYFDNAVIIVDEIHNLTRLMQGTIDSYLVGKTGTAPKDVIAIGKWKVSPELCNNIDMKIKRGYSFYRLLLGAVNSKIIGLSGTPLINFPEELGILMNVLHSYIPFFAPQILEQGDAVIKKIEDIARKNLYTDYVNVSPNTSGGTLLKATFLPIGVRKVFSNRADPGTFLGVERIPLEEKIPLYENIINDLFLEIQAAGFTFKSGVMESSRALPLLPFDKESFKGAFIDENSLKIKNENVLVTRMTGLISYYKGSDLDLMPRVKEDLIISVPFSPYQKRMYSLKRSEEIKKRKKGKSILDDALGDSGDASTYRMASRQMCNYVFPEEVTRPRPKNKREMLEEANDALKTSIINKRKLN